LRLLAPTEVVWHCAKQYQDLEFIYFEVTGNVAIETLYISKQDSLK